MRETFDGIQVVTAYCPQCCSVRITHNLPLNRMYVHTVRVGSSSLFFFVQSITGPKSKKVKPDADSFSGE